MSTRLEEISFKTKMLIDFALPKIFLFFAVIWTLQALQSLFVNPFSAIRLWMLGFPMHSTTALNLTLLYIVNYFFYRTFLPGHIRVVRATLFTFIGVFFYDFVWAVCRAFITGNGFLDYALFILPLASFLAVLGCMYIFNLQSKNYTFFNFKGRYILIIVVVYALSLAVWVYSGFFEQFALCEQSLAVDPHGWEWLFNKTVTLWMWMIVAQR